MKKNIVFGNDPTLYNKLISLCHDSFMGGHSSATVIVKRVKGIFYQKRQQKHVRQFVRECLFCQKNKNENVFTLGLLYPLLIPQAVFINIKMDFIEGLPKSDGNEVIFIVLDRFSKNASWLLLILIQPSLRPGFLQTMYTNYMTYLLPQ